MTELSILIPTLPSRSYQFNTLVSSLEATKGDSQIEILGLLDNRVRSIGDKRNQLVNMARGAYFSFIDDDDTVSRNYVTRIVSAIRDNPGVDCITFNRARHCVVGPKVDPLITIYDSKVTIHGQPADGYYSDAYSAWLSIPSHTCVWRKAAVDDLRFPDTSWQEDLIWARQARYRICTTYNIPNKVLYTYNFDPTRKAGG
jgi:hypothetical protein